MSKTNTKKTRKQKTVFITEVAVLAALILVMSLTPLGFLTVGALSITLIMIPVVLGSVLCGPTVGAILGAIFGIVSFAKCFAGEPLGAILVSVSVWRTLFCCIVPRVIAGLIPGLLFRFLAKWDKKQNWSFIVVSAVGSLLNTVLFLGSVALLFWNVTFTPEQAISLGGIDTVLKTVILLASGINAPIELLVCTILSSVIGKGLLTATKKIR